MAAAGNLNKIDGDILYGADILALLDGYGCIAAQNTNRLLKADTSVFTNKLYSGADDFTDENGVMNTVDTTASTAVYDTSSNDNYFLNIGTDEASGDSTHDPSAFNNPSNAFDDDEDTYADRSLGNTLFGGATEYLGKTFTAKTIKGIRYKGWISAQNNDASVKSLTLTVQTYNGSTWSTVATELVQGQGNPTTSFFEAFVKVDSSIEGVRIGFAANSTNNTSWSASCRLYSLEYSTTYQSSSTVETDTILNDGIVPKSIVVYGEKTVPTDTSITVDVSDDGGTTFGVTGGALDAPIDTTALSGSNIALKFNLSTTDTTKTPLLYGYGLAITNS